MGRAWWTFVFAVSCVMPGGEEMPRDRELPDGFVETGCRSIEDCDDGDPCTTEGCQLNGECSHTQVDCSALNTGCEEGICVDGACQAEPAHEGERCSTISDAPGKCAAGVCESVPLCNMYVSLSTCTYTTRTATLPAMSKLSDYACATGEAGAEIGFRFRETMDREVTFSLPAGMQDLDLIVLEDTACAEISPCVTSSVNTGGGAESVTFLAKAGVDYVVVVESKSAAGGSVTLSIGCATCEPVQALACNMSVSGNTTGSTATQQLGGYVCGGVTTAYPGPEQTYTVRNATAVQYSVKLTGQSEDHDLMVLSDSSGVCNLNYCTQTSKQMGTADEQVAWNGTANTTYHLVVDAKGSGGAYQLQVDCPPSCVGSRTLSCSAPTDTRRNDDVTYSSQLVNSWSCAPNTGGREVMYRFYAGTAGMMTLELTGLTADLDLIVVEGQYSVCDPTATCKASSVTAGVMDETVTFMAQAGKYYWIAVDGKTGATSNYTLRLKSPSCPVSCYNAVNSLSCTYLSDVRRNDDVARSRDLVDDWSCDNNMTGPEVVYQFKPTASGMYTVTLDQLTADLDLVVVQNTSSTSCDANAACVASSKNNGNASESLTFNANSLYYYSVAVDGKQGAVSPYRISVASAACPPATCKNGFKNLSCTAYSTFARNDASGATNNVNNWACDTGATGPEFAHLFTPTGPGPYTVELIGLQANLNLYVLETASSTLCDPAAACTASSKQVGTTSEKLTFTADPTKLYWFIVDGVGGAISPYTLAVTGGCP